jgi:hypothetical protein
MVSPMGVFHPRSARLPLPWHFPVDSGSCKRTHQFGQIRARVPYHKRQEIEPYPPELLEKLDGRSREMANKILGMLTGGDRRSIGRSDGVAGTVLKEPSLFADLFAGFFDANPVIRMRAADAVEKCTRNKPELLTPWKKSLLEQLYLLNEKEVRWHIAQLIPRLRMTASEQATAVQILMDYLKDESSIVRTFSMQALADLVQHDDQLRPQAVALIELFAKTGTPAMKSRARKLLRQLARRPRERTPDNRSPKH